MRAAADVLSWAFGARELLHRRVELGTPFSSAAAAAECGVEWGRCVQPPALAAAAAALQPAGPAAVALLLLLLQCRTAWMLGGWVRPVHRGASRLPGPRLTPVAGEGSGGKGRIGGRRARGLAAGGRRHGRCRAVPVQPAVRRGGACGWEGGGGGLRLADGRCLQAWAGSTAVVGAPTPAAPARAHAASGPRAAPGGGGAVAGGRWGAAMRRHGVRARTEFRRAGRRGCWSCAGRRGVRRAAPRRAAAGRGLAGACRPARRRRGRVCGGGDGAGGGLGGGARWLGLG